MNKDDLQRLTRAKKKSKDLRNFHLILLINAHSRNSIDCIIEYYIHLHQRSETELSVQFDVLKTLNF